MSVSTWQRKFKKTEAKKTRKCRVKGLCIVMSCTRNEYRLAYVFYKEFNTIQNFDLHFRGSHFSFNFHGVKKQLHMRGMTKSTNYQCISPFRRPIWFSLFVVTVWHHFLMSLYVIQVSSCFPIVLIWPGQVIQLINDKLHTCMSCQSWSSTIAPSVTTNVTISYCPSLCTI